MRTRVHGAILCAATLACLGLAGCKSTGKGAESEVQTQEAAPVKTAVDYEVELRLAAASDFGNDDGKRPDFQVHNPYFYKEYAEYPDGTSDFEVKVVQRESKTSPYVADVTINKIRYSTRPRTNREEARVDEDFLRDTGIETVTYELRNGEWRRSSSFFLSNETEQMIDGQWQKVSRAAPQANTEEAAGRDSWLGKTWNRLRFWK